MTLAAVRQCRGVTAIAAGVAAALYGSPAISDDQGVLEEVVVTATRHATSAQDVPLSITAVSGATLEQAGIQDIAGLAQSVAGVAYTDKGPYGGVSGSTLVIRGLNSEDTSQVATASPVVPPVATYVDETPLFVNLRLQDLDHVEVLRGPQGTLYGSGSLGGTIRFVQNAPDPRSFDARAEVGVSDTRHTHSPNEDFHGLLNLPITDTFAVRLNASFTDEAGYINQPNLFVLNSAGVPVPRSPATLLSPAQTYSKDGVNSYGYRTARVAALWKPNENFRAQLNYYYQLSTGSGFPFASPNTYGISSLSTSDYVPESTRDKVDLAALTLEYDLGFATMTSASSWAKHHNQTLQDVTANYETLPFYTPYYGGNPRAYFRGENAFDDKLWAQEIRLASKSGSSLDWVGGLFFRTENSAIQNHEFDVGYDDYYRSCAPIYGAGSLQCGPGEYGSLNHVSQINGITLIPDLAYIGDFETHFQDLAAFGEGTLHLNSAWTLTGGARVFRQNVTQGQQTALLFVGPSYIDNESRSARWRRALWKINSAYHLDSSNLIYATWSQGFRRGGVNALPPTEPVGNYVTPPALSSVQPDTANNYEIGAKGTVNNRFRYSAAVYDIQWKNIQEEAFLTPLVLPGMINAGNGYSRGIEMELFEAITRRLNLQLGYTFDETKLTSLSPVALIGLSVAPPVGSQLPGTPKNSVALGIEYGHLPVAQGEMRFALNGHYQSRVVPSISLTVPTVAGYSVLDARMSYSRSHWVSTIYVDNLTNALAVSSFTDPAIWGYRYNAIVSRPRTVGFTLAYGLKQL